MKKIIYYITDHGLGHTTRSIGIIRELEKNGYKVIVRNNSTNKILRKALPKNKIISGKTDVGPIIEKNGISINKHKTKLVVGHWIESINRNSIKESKIIKKIKPDVIISDVSVMPLVAAKSLEVPSIIISNFSWYDTLSMLSQKNKNLLKKYYDNADLAIKLSLGTKMSHFKNKINVGIISRQTTTTKLKIRKKLKIKNSESLVLLYLDSIKNKIKKDEQIKVIRLGTKTKCEKLISDENEGQDLVLAADLVICKCGYSIISECLNNQTPFLYIKDKNHIEQNAISKELKKLKINNEITLKEFQSINFSKKWIKSIKSHKKVKNENRIILKIIDKFLKN